jgi:hypothetical protein
MSRRSVARVTGTPLVAIAVTAAGIGWLYLLRRTGGLRAGPTLHEALPLQRLAGGSDQPLVRVVAAWLPAGLVSGVLLWAIGFPRRPVRAAVTFVGCLALLLALGAAADAVTASDPLRAHIAQQPHRVAIWLAAGLAAVGASLPGRRPLSTVRTR